MTDYYTPNILFRLNAMRISPYLSSESLPMTGSANKNASTNVRASLWIMQETQPHDLALLNKACGLNKMNIKSNYWKIPDDSNYLTAMDVVEWNHQPLVAVSSGSKQSNLFFYQLDPIENYLVHNTTITLPNIHSMKWLTKNNASNDNLTLAVGNDNGYSHVIQVPEPGSKRSGEIIKRMNHAKYLKTHTPGKIDKINIIEDDLLSIYKGNLFRWDVYSGKNKPVSIQTIKGVKTFDVITNNTSTVALGGDFGVSLFDLREKEFKIPSSMVSKYKDYLGASHIKWSPTNEYLFAAVHKDSKVRIWDTRMQDFYGCLSTGSQERDSRVTCLEWNGDDIFTGGKDGKIVHWDLLDTTDSLLNCLLKEGLDSIDFNPKTNRLEQDFTQRQCGTVISASNTNITSMVSLEFDDEHRILLADGSSFFGVHLKIYESVNDDIHGEKLYYSANDLALLEAMQESSNDTLIDDELSDLEFVSTEPLKFSRMPTIKEMSVTDLATTDNSLKAIIKDIVKAHINHDTPTRHSIIPENNMSNETLLDSPKVHYASSPDEFLLPDRNSEFSDISSVSSLPTVLGDELIGKVEDIEDFNFSLVFNDMSALTLEPAY